MKHKYMLAVLISALLMAACQPAAPATEAPAEAPAVEEEAPEPAVEEEAAEPEAEPAEAESEAEAEEQDPVLLALELADKAAAGEAAEINSESDITIGVVMPALDNDGWRAIYIGVLSKIIEMDVNLITLDARDSVENQTAMIEDLITKQVDAIVFVPVDSAAMSTAVQLANQANIPVVTMDRSTEGGDVTALVESNNVEIGAKGADLMVEVAEKSGIALEDLVVLEIMGNLATSAGKERHEGFTTRAEELGLEIAVQLAANWSAEEANAVVLDAFQANPDINAIYNASGCAHHSGVEPALISIDKWIPAGEEGHIILISTDGCPAPLEAIRQGYVDADSAQQLLTMGQTAIEVAVNAVNGIEPEEPIIRLGPDPITPDNVDDPFHWANAVNTAR